MRALAIVALLAGLGVPLWVGLGYVGQRPLALATTLLIIAVYLLGAREIWRFHRASASLRSALLELDGAPPTLDVWLARLDSGLRSSVRARIETGRAGLPGPVLAPYLVGLLVLLGMLGTFMGMVLTLKGTVLALESTADLPALRAALSAPVQGLGLAFGTSVAGVAASAMLGLVMALARRERAMVVQALDTAADSRLRSFARARQGEALLAAAQEQATLMPQVVQQLQALMTQMGEQNASMHQQLVANQGRMQDELRSTYGALAESVGAALRESARAGASAAAAAVEPLVERSLAGLNANSAAFQAQLTDVAGRQLAAWTERFDQATTHVSSVWMDALVRQQQYRQAADETLQQSLQDSQTRFDGRWQALLAEWADAQSAQHARVAADDERRLAAWAAAVAEMGASARKAWLQASTESRTLQGEICNTLAATASDIQQQTRAQAEAMAQRLAQLIELAGQAPKAASELAAQWREQLAEGQQRDLLWQRKQAETLATVQTLVDELTRTATRQREAMDGLLAASVAALEAAREQSTSQLAAQAQGLEEAAAQLTAGGVEMASLGDAFGVAVTQFGQSSQRLVAQMSHIESALERARMRSDDQLAYYVAQARELFDLCLSAQQQTLADLKRLGVRGIAPAQVTE